MFEYTRKEITNPTIKRANELLYSLGLAGYDMEFFNDIESIEYIYDINLDKIPRYLINEKYFNCKYFINNENVKEITNIYEELLTEKEAIEMAKIIIRELEN